MPTIRFENTDERYKKEAGHLLKSLQLDPERWLEDQEFELMPQTQAEVFGVKVHITDALIGKDQWVCRIEEQNGSRRLMVGDYVWAVDVAAGAVPEDAVAALPEDIEVLSLANLALEDLGFLAKLTKLTSLNLGECGSLEDFSVLTGLTRLTSLALWGCSSLADFGGLSRLRRLESLDLGRCDFLTDLSGLSGLTKLNSLALWGCESLTDISGLSELTQITSLDLGWNASLANLSGLSGLEQLASLRLSDCISLTDLSGLSGLTQLTSLDLNGCKSLADISGLFGLTQLTSLDLRRCESLKDLRGLSGLAQLTSLEMGDCGSLTDLSGLAGVKVLSGLSGLKQLTSLYMGSCLSLTELSGLSGLTQLTSLTIDSCFSLTDLSGLSGLRQLTRLELHGFTSLTNISALSGLTQLSRLYLGRSDSLTDISGLSELTQLASLYLGGCRSLTDISGLSGLTQLASLGLSQCSSLTDLTSLSGLLQLTSLDLNGCESLTDISPLSGLTHLANLELSRCHSLSNISPISELTQLTDLNLSGCERIRSLDAISKCVSLSQIDVESCKRLTSIEPVREIAVLRKLTGFNPDQAAELLAHTAVLRKDGAYIDEHASAWLQQIQQMDEAAPEERERFATTLGEALCLLGESPHEETYEAYLASRPEFSASPWKAWFSGTRELSGWELMRVRVERQQLAEANPGCIGGVCASFLGERGDEEVSGDERQWALDWLGRMEQAWADRGNELLPVAAEVCVAHLRHGLDDALERWLLRLTDESDPASLDPVHLALGSWQLERGNPDAARNHADAIETPELRDPLLAELAKHYVAGEPQTAGDLLLTISSPPMRREIMELLCADTSFVANPVNVERLVVACGDSAEALAGLIAKLPAETDPALLEALSKALREGDKNRRELQRNVLQQILVELEE